MLNKKVLNKIRLNVPESILNDLANGKTGIIEKFLFNLRLKIDEELEFRKRIRSQNNSSPHQSLILLNNINSINENKSILTKRTNRTSRSVGNLTQKWVSRLDYEELKQNYLQLQEQLEILQVKMRRLEHSIQLKEIRISELSKIIDDIRHTKSTPFINTKYKNK